MRPPGAIESEDAIAQEWVELLVSCSKREILKLGCQNCLDIFGLPRRYYIAREECLFVGISMDGIFVIEMIDPALFVDSLSQPNKPRNTKEGRGA